MEKIVIALSLFFAFLFVVSGCKLNDTFKEQCEEAFPEEKSYQVECWRLLRDNQSILPLIEKAGERIKHAK